jgi:hypothetical protein
MLESNMEEQIKPWANFYELEERIIENLILNKNRDLKKKLVYCLFYLAIHVRSFIKIFQIATDSATTGFQMKSRDLFFISPYRNCPITGLSP